MRQVVLLLLRALPQAACCSGFLHAVDAQGAVLHHGHDGSQLCGEQQSLQRDHGHAVVRNVPGTSVCVPLLSHCDRDACAHHGCGHVDARGGHVHAHEYDSDYGDHGDHGHARARDRGHGDRHDGCAAVDGRDGPDGDDGHDHDHGRAHDGCRGRDHGRARGHGHGHGGDDDDDVWLLQV